MLKGQATTRRYPAVSLRRPSSRLRMARAVHLDGGCGMRPRRCTVIQIETEPTRAQEPPPVVVRAARERLVRRGRRQRQDESDQYARSGSAVMAHVMLRARHACTYEQQTASAGTSPWFRARTRSASCHASRVEVRSRRADAAARLQVVFVPAVTRSRRRTGAALPKREDSALDLERVGVLRSGCRRFRRTTTRAAATASA